SIVGVEHRQPGLGAEVRQQQEALLQVTGDDVRHMDTSIAKQVGDVDKRATVLLFRRRIHADQRAITEVKAEIAAKTGIRRRRHTTHRAPDLLRYPLLQRLFAYIVARLHCCPHSIKLPDRKSTRLNSSHVKISYAVFCLKK